MSHWDNTFFPHDPLLDLEPWVGQRQASFRFDLINGVTEERLGELTPIRTATLSHDTSRMIKRDLKLELGVTDTAAINPITDRVRLYMVFPNGTEYPLGRYMWTDASDLVSTRGRLNSSVLNDEMFLVDQQITSGISNGGASAEFLLSKILSELVDVTVNYTLETSPFTVSGAWTTGSNRGALLEAIAIQGDYFSPWFDHTGTMQFIRTFDPAIRMPDLDWDRGNKVLRDSIVETSDILTAPNRFIVISNDALDPSVELTAIADIPATAPHSIANRGFVIAHTEDLQLADATQATAVANGIANRMTVFQRIGINTIPDPRHDSYNVIRWDGANWLELAWSMPLQEGAAMSHLLRKAYE